MAEKKIRLPKGTKVPNHIAVILDGNRRWARSRGLPTLQGHRAGFEASKKIANSAREFGVHTFTVWGFSTENWDRSPSEVRYLMKLFKEFFEDVRGEAQESGTRVIHLGRKDRLPKYLVKLIKEVEEETSNNKKHVLNVALDYGGRDEILRAVRKIVKDGVDEKKIDEKLFSSYLDTHSQPYPYPDLFIRPSGEQRTSGLLPWQMTYAEYYWERDHLPDMNAHKLKKAIVDYSRRRRRFGANDAEEHLAFRPEVVAKLELNWWRLANIPEGTTFSEYAVGHLREQWGLSVGLATDAARYMVEASLMGKKKRWGEATRAMGEFYRLIRDEVKLAFEPKVVASLEMKLWRDYGKDDEATREEIEGTLRTQIAEVYRISEFQAAKAAHLRALATVERRNAERTQSDLHWERAEDYLEKYYKALKERVA